MLKTKGNDLYRMKGVLSIKGSDKRLVFQGVHMLFDAKFDRPWGKDPRTNTLVFIGKSLDRAALNEVSRAASSEQENRRRAAPANHANRREFEAVPRKTRNTLKCRTRRSKSPFVCFVFFVVKIRFCRGLAAQLIFRVNSTRLAARALSDLSDRTSVRRPSASKALSACASVVPPGTT